MTVADRPVRVGIIGCGVISKAYLDRLATFPFLEVTTVADLVTERAATKASEFGIARACSPDELLSDPDVDIVVNLTIPAAHAAIGLAAVAADKSVYTEKPLALTRTEGQAVVAAAEAKGLRVGCAPDTFLGAGLQTCRRLLDDGVIGEPLGATGFMVGPGPEAWHPDPAFFYHHGAGPLFDVGVYYLTAFVSLLGPVARVSGSARISRSQREIGSMPFKGQLIDVEVPTHIAMSLDFESGPVASVVASFDVQGSHLPRMEIYGTEGTLALPDPNTFGGPVRVLRKGEKEWTEIPLIDGYAEQARGIGLADMVLAMDEKRPHLASGDLALHVLDLMQAVHEASAEERYVRPETTCARPEPLQYPLVGA
jgi:predicted dehydrogenase